MVGNIRVCVVNQPGKREQHRRGEADAVPAKHSCGVFDIEYFDTQRVSIIKQVVGRADIYR